MDQKDQGLWAPGRGRTEGGGMWQVVVALTGDEELEGEALVSGFQRSWDRWKKTDASICLAVSGLNNGGYCCWSRLPWRRDSPLGWDRDHSVPVVTSHANTHTHTCTLFRTCFLPKYDFGFNNRAFDSQQNGIWPESHCPQFTCSHVEQEDP